MPSHLSDHMSNASHQTNSSGCVKRPLAGQPGNKRGSKFKARNAGHKSTAKPAKSSNKFSTNDASSDEENEEMSFDDMISNSGSDDHDSSLLLNSTGYLVASHCDTNTVFIQQQQQFLSMLGDPVVDANNSTVTILDENKNSVKYFDLSNSSCFPGSLNENGPIWSERKTNCVLPIYTYIQI